MSMPLDPESAGGPVPAPQRVNLVGEPPSAQRPIEPTHDCVPLRVVLVDDAPSTRRLLRGVIDCVPSLAVVGEADNGSHAIESVERLQPDVVLLDLSLPDTDGAQVLPELLRVAPGVRIVVLSHSSRSAGPGLVAAGAAGFIEKGLAPYALVDQLSTVLGVPLGVVSAPAPDTHGPQTRDAEPSSPQAEASPRSTPLPHPDAPLLGSDNASVSLAGATILLVDDHEVVRRGICALIEMALGCEVVEASSCEEALAVLTGRHIDLLLVDARMPIHDGIYTLERAREIHPELPALVLSTYATNEFVDRALAAGANGYLLKDSTLEQLREAIDTALFDRGTYLSPSIARDLYARMRPPDSDG